MINVILSCAVFLTCIKVSAKVSAQELNILSYGSIGSTLSGEVLLLIENVIQNKQNNIQLVEIKKGLAFAKNSTYLLTGSDKSDDYMDRILKTEKMSKNQFIAFESDRSILLVPHDAPAEFINLIKAKKNTHMNYQNDTRFWNDLRWSDVTGGHFDQSGLAYFDFKRKEWAKNTSWDNSFYFEYRLTLNEMTFTVTILPKSFGGLPRIMTVLKNEQKNSPLIFATGDITPDLSDPDNSEVHSFEELSRFPNQFVSASFADLNGFDSVYSEYKKKWPSDPPIEFLSANICEKNENVCTYVYKPFKIVNHGGRKIAIIGLTSPGEQVLLDKYSAKYDRLKKYVIKDPASILTKEILPKVKSLADFVILVTNMTPEEYTKLAPKILGVDLVIKRHNRLYSWNQSDTLVFKNYSARYPQYPLLEVKANELTINKIRISQKKNKLTLKYHNIPLDQTVSSDTHYRDHWLSMAIFTGSDIVLPDHKKLYPNDTNKLIVSEEEFGQLAAELMRSELTAEVGLFNIQKQRSNVIGEQDSSVIRTWILPEEQLQVVMMRGESLKAIIQQNKNNKTDTFKLAISGVDTSGSIAGLPIQNSEIYKVVTSNTVSSNLTAFPAFSQALSITKSFVVNEGTYIDEPQGHEIPLVDFLVESLRKKWKLVSQLEESKRNALYRDLYEGTPSLSQYGYWVHEIKGLRLEYSAFSTSDVKPFSAVQDNRLQSADLQNISSNLSYVATYRKRPYISELGLKAQYDKQQIKPSNSPAIDNVLADDLVGFANIGLPIYKIEDNPLIGNQMGPVFELAYDTEFEKDPNQELQRNIQAYLGWRLYNGTVINSATLSYLFETRLTTGREKNQRGLSAKAEIQKVLKDGTALLKSELDYRFYFNDDSDSGEDLRSRLVLDTYFDYKLNHKLSFGPYLKIYSIQGKTFNETLNQTLIGINFNFSGMWKPRYHKSVY